MKIYSMTATFGKLENQTLTFQPGLNVIHAPNEWGKSTWCAFLAIMLYGLETRAKTTKTALADKERYAPWSGAAMAGRMDLQWNGRDITIERWTKGRTPMGEFKAYETETGLPVPELTGATCGEKLLGVERSVFLRAGFLRLSDLPVTQDESLRRRLNALVTTGDESSDGDMLRQKLKDLKNKCRYNRSGLLPQAEAQRAELENKLSELLLLQSQAEKAKIRQQQLEDHILSLENHKATLEYQEAEENIHRVAAAQETAAIAQARTEALAAQCAALPDRQAAKVNLEKLQLLHQQQLAAQMDVQMLPQPPQAPAAPPYFYGLDGQQAIAQARRDADAYVSQQPAVQKMFPLWIVALAVAALGVVLMALNLLIPGAAAVSVAAVLFVIYTIQSKKYQDAQLQRRVHAENIRARYGGGEPADWMGAAVNYADQLAAFRQEMAGYQRQRSDMEQRLAALNAAITEAAEGMSLAAAMERWRWVQQQWESLDDAHREQQRAAGHAEAMKAVAKSVEKPLLPDDLTYTALETARLLSDAKFEQKQLQVRFGQYQGRMDALGSEAALKKELEHVNGRIARLSDTYTALERALNALDEATAQLQRRFAPRISKEAQRIFGTLTGGRYDRLTLSQDLSVNAGTTEETVLRSAMWRSEGTIDQLYLALRLAVAKELTPDAPMVLDDALVRFDDIRHAAAMELLRQEAEHKQIILFTCQKRELEA